MLSGLHETIINEVVTDLKDIEVDDIKNREHREKSESEKSYQEHLSGLLSEASAKLEVAPK